MAVDIDFDLNELQVSVSLQPWLHCWCWEPSWAGSGTLPPCWGVLLDGAGLRGEVGSEHHGMEGARKPLTGEALGAHSSGSLQARQVPKGWGMQPLMLGWGAGPISSRDGSPGAWDGRGAAGQNAGPVVARGG